MPYYNKCPGCGANLDPGEPCRDCEEKEKARLGERTDSKSTFNSSLAYHKKQKKSIRNGGKV